MRSIRPIVEFDQGIRLFAKTNRNYELQFLSQFVLKAEQENNVFDLEKYLLTIIQVEGFDQLSHQINFLSASLSLLFNNISIESRAFLFIRQGGVLLNYFLKLGCLSLLEFYFSHLLKVTEKVKLTLSEKKTCISHLRLQNAMSLTPLHRLVRIQPQYVLQLYLQCLANIASSDDIKQTFLQVSIENYSFLHGIAYCGYVGVLQLTADFLQNTVGRIQAGSMLVALAKTPSLYGDLPCHSEKNHSINMYLALLQQNKPEQVLISLLKGKTVRAIPFCYFNSSLLLFSPKEAEAKLTPELDDAESYLPKTLMHSLNFS